MKKILTLISLLGLFAISASAQRSIHLKVITNVSNGDTVVIDSVNSVQYIIYHGFVNNGPDAAVAGDSLFFKKPYGTSFYILAPTDIPFAMGDTIGYFVDTVAFSNGPATGNTQWCDSAWMKNSTNVITDPAAAAECVTVFIDNKNGQTGLLTNSLDKVQFTLYPNPAADEVNFSYNFTKAANVNVRIMDIAGRVLNTENFGKINSGNHTFTTNISALPKGTYILEFIADDKRGVAKFTKN